MSLYPPQMDGKRSKMLDEHEVGSENGNGNVVDASLAVILQNCNRLARSTPLREKAGGYGWAPFSSVQLRPVIRYNIFPNLVVPARDMTIVGML
ncbi:hypothetical protein WAI453_005343 [Rhynchosporium graminicola]